MIHISAVQFIPLDNVRRFTLLCHVPGSAVCLANMGCDICFLKKVENKFAGLKIMSTFAIPNQNGIVL